MPPATRVWYAAYTNSRAEKKVACELEKIGIEHYLPLVLTLRQWSDRKKKVEVPLIRSYIFVHISRRQHLPVLLVPGVVKILHFCGRPVPIPDWQINNLKILMGAAIPVSHTKRKYIKGDDVQIINGNMKGLRGIISQTRGSHKLVISISALNFNLSIDIDPSFVEPV
jgi:transcription antitermination factor NusG